MCGSVSVCVCAHALVSAYMKKSGVVSLRLYALRCFRMTENMNDWKNGKKHFVRFGLLCKEMVSLLCVVIGLRSMKFDPVCSHCVLCDSVCSRRLFASTAYDVVRFAHIQHRSLHLTWCALLPCGSLNICHFSFATLQFFVHAGLMCWSSVRSQLVCSVSLMIDRIFLASVWVLSRLSYGWFVSDVFKSFQCHKH